MVSLNKSRNSALLMQLEDYSLSSAEFCNLLSRFSLTRWAWTWNRNNALTSSLIMPCQTEQRRKSLHVNFGGQPHTFYTLSSPTIEVQLRAFEPKILKMEGVREFCTFISVIFFASVICGVMVLGLLCLLSYVTLFKLERFLKIIGIFSNGLFDPSELKSKNYTWKSVPW